jgi:hypothetical protein
MEMLPAEQTALENSMEPKEKEPLSQVGLQNAVDDYKTPEKLNQKDWKKVCALLTAKMKSLVSAGKPDGEETAEVGTAIFSIVQQVSSVLRTVLSQELGSRENVILVKVKPVN